VKANFSTCLGTITWRYRKGMGVKLHTRSTSALYRGYQSASRSARFTHRNIIMDTKCMRLGITWWRWAPARNRTTAAQPVASRFTSPIQLYRLFKSHNTTFGRYISIRYSIPNLKKIRSQHVQETDGNKNIQTNSLVQCLSWKLTFAQLFNKFALSQNPKFNYHIHKSPPLVPVRRQMNLVHNLVS
jgi:hypothetical protein